MCRPLRPAPPRSESGEEPRGARERCRDAGVPCRSLGRVTRGGERRGRVRARPSAAGTPIPPLPRGCVRTRLRSGRGAERGKNGAGWRWAPGPHPPTVRAPPRAVPPALPRLCRSRGPRPRCARRVRASLVLCAVWRSPRSPPPRQRSHGWGAAVDPSLLGVGDPVLALRGRDLSLGCGLWRERRSVVSRRVAGRVGARRRRRAFLRRRRARLSRRWVRARRGCERQASRVSGTSRRERGFSGRPSSAAWRRVRRPRCVWGLFRPRRRRPPGRRVSRGEPPTHWVGCLAVR